MGSPFPFEEPSKPGDRFSAEMAQRKRLVLVPIEYIPVITTARGDQVDAIKINVVDLEDPTGPKAYWGALWFGNKLIQTFRPKLGKMFLGYVDKAPTGGGFRAWVFTSLTNDEATVGMAQQFLANNPEFMETCIGDMAMAQQQAQKMAETAAQGQQLNQYQQPYQAQQQLPQHQPAYPGSGQVPQYPPGVRAQQPGGWSQGPQNQQDMYPPTPQGPAPLPPPGGQGPAPLPPQTQQDPWPAQAYTLPGNGAPVSAPPQAPASPAPVGGSVMDRLRAQRDAGSDSPPPAEAPF